MIHRPFNKSLIKDDDFIKISKTDRLADEIYYYQSIQRFEQKKHFAEFRGDVSDGNCFGLNLKLYNANNFYENLKTNIDRTLPFIKIIEVLKDLHSVEPVKICNELEDTQINQKILIDKTVSEFAKFINKANVYLDHLKWKSSIVINDVECLHFQEIWPPLKKIIHNNYLEGKLSLIHGDFCFANILHDLSDNKIILVDPRGSYHIRGCFGDKAYDYAKLLHSVHGNYEQIIYDDYDFYLNKNEINYTFKYNFDDLNEILKKEIDPHLFEKSKLIEGLLFISMCSRHYENEQHQIIMYCQGLRILNQIYKDSIQALKSDTV